jgi:hypothetical protein
MRGLVLSVSMLLGAICLWGLWAHTIITLELAGAFTAALTVACLIWRRIDDRRRRDDFPSARWLN